MKVETIYVAEDGRKFNDEYDCILYERELKVKTLEETIFLFDQDGHKLPLTNDSVGEAYCIVSKSKEASLLASELFDEYQNPFHLGEAGTWYYFEDDRWISADEIITVANMIKTIEEELGK